MIWRTIVELVASVLLVVGFCYEDKIVAFENKILGRFEK